MKYRKRPVVIDAVQFTGNNKAEVTKFFNEALPEETIGFNVHNIIIPTLEGNMTASIGDYIIRGIRGEYYPCKPDIFYATYEIVDKTL